MADSNQHKGNIQPFLDLEEHDGANYAKRVNVVAGTINAAGQATVVVQNLASAATIFAVVNTTAAGQASVVLDNSIAKIGFATVNIANAVGNATLNPSPNFIGIVTIANASMPVTFSGNVTLDDGSLTGIVGNVTLSDAKTFIGLVSVSGFANPMPVLHTGAGNVTLSDAKTYIGLTTSTLGVGDRFIGLVTANSINVGTNKALVILPVGLGNNSLTTVAVPTNAQRIKVTNLLLSSNITTEIAIKSGVTYLTGNASLGVTLFPGGGFELPGSPDSPSWIGLPSGAMVIEKRDGGGTVSKIGGDVIYFDET